MEPVQILTLKESKVCPYVPFRASDILRRKRKYVASNNVTFSCLKWRCWTRVLKAFQHFRWKKVITTGQFLFFYQWAYTIRAYHLRILYSSSFPECRIKETVGGTETGTHYELSSAQPNTVTARYKE